MHSLALLWSCDPENAEMIILYHHGMCSVQFALVQARGLRLFFLPSLTEPTSGRGFVVLCKTTKPCPPVGLVQAREAGTLGHWGR